MSADGSPVLFRRAGKRLNRRSANDFATVLLREVTDGRPFTCLLTDDRELKRLNSQFLNHDYPTDVLSFPSDGEAGLGEIAISTERAADQARDHGHGLDEEICVLMLHGVLHLTGMDHESDRGAMRKAEAQWRRKLRLPATTLIARAK